MRSLVIITDVTRMQGRNICIAGYCPDGSCVRPEFRQGRPDEDWLRMRCGKVIHPFVEVELDLLRNVPHPPHTEDWYIDPRHCVYRRSLAPADRQHFLENLDDGSVKQIFGAEIHRGPGWYVKANEGNRSLGTICPRRIHEISCFMKDQQKWDYRIEFTDRNGDRYRLMITDLALRYYLDDARSQGKSPREAAQTLLKHLQIARTYLRIGLARGGWTKYPGCCFLQINGIYSFPDYLGGRNFSDFI